MSEVAKRPIITPTDRLGLTFCLAIISHAIIVLGVTFATEDVHQPRYNTMDIVLVQQRSKPVDEAKLLAQANLEGGGDSEEDLTPSTPLPPPFPDNQPEVAAPPPLTAPSQASTEANPATSTAAETVAVEARETLAAESANAKASSSKPEKQPEKEGQKDKKAEKTVKKNQKPRPRTSAAALLTNSYKIASLSAKVERQLVAKAKRPKRKFISASTREYKYAAYMEAWRAKVERVGNLNYPEQARKRKLSGNLMLDVALNPDGSINMITIRRSSGHKILDDAAIRIVKLSAPFAPFPGSIRKEVDILHITRTWQFLNNRGFR